MAFGNGPSIVTNGLVLSLDAADRNSYPGSGTTWRDLSGNNNTGTLTNGPTFSSANSGRIVFDGADDFVTLGNPSTLQFTSATPFSVSGWFNLSSMPAIGSIFTKNGSDGGYRMIYGSTWSGQILVTITATGVGNAYNATSNITLSTNTWYHYAFTYNQPTLNLYINGALDKTFTSNRTLANTTANFNIGANFTGGENLAGTIPNIQAYNRVLSLTEILQNYNATKTRFGL